MSDVANKYGSPKEDVEPTPERLPDDVDKLVREQGREMRKSGIEPVEASRETPGELASPTTPGQHGTDGQFDRANPIAEKYAGQPPEPDAQKEREVQREEPERE